MAKEINETAKPIYKAREPKKANYECICKFCGKTFKANRRTALYCSDLCRLENYRKKHLKK